MLQYAQRIFLQSDALGWADLLAAYRDQHDETGGMADDLKLI
jgi:hypothetical protein